MLESTRTRDGGKEAEAQGWVGACAFGNGCGGGAAANWMPDESKCPPPQAPPSSLLESISGEFALIISGHSLVGGSSIQECHWKEVAIHYHVFSVLLD